MATEYVLTQVASEVQTAINNALNPDTSLTVSGKPADAKAVGDAISSCTKPTDEQVAIAVTSWLDEHPEATTTVEDWSITYEKLHPDTISQLSEDKVALPKAANGGLDYGTAGYYAVSDGAGGILWVEGGGTGGSGGAATVRGIVWDLVNVTSSNPAVSVVDGASLTAVLTPADGYTLGDVTVTMGGEALTGVWNADTATVTIASVTGDVVISCVGVEIVTLDTTAVIAQEGKGIGYDGNSSNKDGYGITKVYEFTYDVEALKQSPKYDATNDYLTGPAMGGFIVHIPNTNFVANGGDTSGSSGFGRHRYTADGVYIGVSSNPALGGKMTFTQKNSAILNANVVGVEFNIPLADIDDAYAYWCTPNAAACASIFPNGYREGDIIFAGKNTEYYGMANIDGTMPGDEPVAAELSYDDDVMQNYALAPVSILGEEIATDTSTAYGISTELAAVIDEVRTAWMTEYGGDPRKIPLIITTDQHGRTNAGIFNMLGKTLSLHDVSKICNLGDTCAVEWNDSSDVPLLSCTTLENWCKSIKKIPFSKRLDVYGNHDAWYYDGYSVEGNTIGTRYPATMHHLDQYFRNIYMRRNNNHGWGVIRDDYFNVKYLIVTGFEYKNGMGSSRISTAQMKCIIDELGKDDGYDIIIMSHVPVYNCGETNVYPTGMTSTASGVLRFSDIDTDELFNARKNKTSGTITDSDGVQHSFDFSDCTTEILCGLNGHMHVDSYNYVAENGLLCAAFDWFDGNTVHFVLVDRVNNRLNVWKLEGDALTYQNYQVPLDKPAE